MRKRGNLGGDAEGRRDRQGAGSMEGLVIGVFEREFEGEGLIVRRKPTRRSQIQRNAQRICRLLDA